VLKGLRSPVLLQTNSTGLCVGWAELVGGAGTVATAVEAVEVGGVVGATVGAMVAAMAGAGMVVERAGALPPHAEIRQMTSEKSKHFFAFCGPLLFLRHKVYFP